MTDKHDVMNDIGNMRIGELPEILTYILDRMFVWSEQDAKNKQIVIILNAIIMVGLFEGNSGKVLLEGLKNEIEEIEEHIE